MVYTELSTTRELCLLVMRTASLRRSEIIDADLDAPSLAIARSTVSKWSSRAG